MKNILFALLLLSLTAHGQNNMADKWILTDSIGWGMANTLSADTIHQYNFGQPLKTYGGRWFTPAVNYIYFSFPDIVRVEKLPIDSFVKPEPIFINTVTPIK